MALYEYKDTSFSRGHRIQNIEETFAKGMSYTTTPLVEGYNRLLTNLNIHDSGNSIVPRRGLKAVKYMFNEGWDRAPGNTHVLYEPLTARRYYDKDVIETVWYTGTGSKLNQKLFTGSIFAQTYDVNGATGAQQHYNSESHTAYLVSNAEAEAHGVRVTPVVISAGENANTLGLRAVGTYAYNDDYYFYDDNRNCCVFSRYPEDVHNEASDVIEHYKNDPKLDVHAPKTLTAKEAVTYGYNMLLSNPYMFTNAAGSAVLEFTGLLPYVDDELCMTPIMNQDITFIATGRIPADKTYKFIAEWAAVNSTTWNKIKEWTLTTTQSATDTQIAFDFVPPVADAIIRITAFPVTEPATEIADSVLAVGFHFQKSDYGVTVNSDKKNYSVHQASGVCYWKNRIVAWGVPEDGTILFLSDVNDPTYFPYPNNIDTFDSAIQYCAPFGDALLVFTADTIYILTLNTDGLSWTTKCLQRNLCIAPWDVHLVQTIKNMLFFKSGNYYYMVVPKSSSLTGELTIADISKPMRSFFDNFKESVLETLNGTYMPAAEYTNFTLAHYYNYISKDDVHNVYMLQVPGVQESNDTYINFDMIYNVVDRTWRIHTYGSASKLIPYNTSSTQDTAFIAKLYNHFIIDQNEMSSLGIQHLHWDLDPEDAYLQFNTWSTIPDEYRDNPGLQVAADPKHSIAGNRQFIDTGYREHASNFKKRYRELQFTINNISQRPLQFYTAFLIDGAPRKTWYGYEIVQDLDPASANYGVISVHRILLPTRELVPGSTALDEWSLNVSAFPDNGYWKCRIPVSGKGYVPRFILNSPNAKTFELLNISWVYRMLYSR